VAALAPTQGREEGAGADPGMMSRVALAAAMAWGIVLAMPSGATGAQVGPMVRAPASSSIGTRIIVSGAGWAPGQLVNMTLCGNGALDGAIDCGVTDVGEAGVTAAGTFFTTYLLAAAPPYPCPCILRTTTSTLDQVVNTPIAIAGLPTARPRPRVVIVSRSVAISDIQVDGHGPWPSWFGAAPHRTLRFEVTNTGQVSLPQVVITVRWGRGASPSGFVPVSALTDLPIGSSQTVRVSIPFSSLSLGTYTVAFRADPLGATVAGAAVHTTVIPWGLILLAAGALARVAWWAGRRAREEAGRAIVAGPEAGWYLDPIDPGRLRLWDGGTWSDEVRPAEGPVPDAGWYEDPSSPGDLRLWDGAAWTDQTSAAGGVLVDR